MPAHKDAKAPDTVYPPIVSLRPPAGAPNVLLVPIDETGFGASRAFGGPCATPNLERLAGSGLESTRFHTTALCSPTRSALSADGALDVGNESGPPVTADDGTRRFNGEVNWVELDVGLADHNHLIVPEDRVHLAIALR